MFKTNVSKVRVLVASLAISALVVYSCSDEQRQNLSVNDPSANAVLGKSVEDKLGFTIPESELKSLYVSYKRLKRNVNVEEQLAGKLDELIDQANKFIYDKIQASGSEYYNTATLTIEQDKVNKTFRIKEVDVWTNFLADTGMDMDDDIDIQHKKEGYVVTCSGGKFNGEKTTCSGLVSCGEALRKCLKGGGCGNICKVKHTTVFEIPTREKPQNTTPEILPEKLP